MEDRQAPGLKPPPLGPDELEALQNLDDDNVLDDLDMTWDDDGGEPSEATHTPVGAPRSSGKASRYKPRVGAARDRNIEVQRRYRQRVRERALETEAAIATTATELEAARAENAALHAHHSALESLSDYSYSTLAALRTFSATVAAAASQYFHALQLRVAVLHADTIEAMFNAVKRPTDAQLRSLAADMGVQTPMLGRINVELMAQLVSLMGQWTAAGPHGRVVVERKLKILFESRERFVRVLLEHYPDKAAAALERLLFQNRAQVHEQPAGGALAAAATEYARRSPLNFIFNNGASLTFGRGGSGTDITAALVAQRASAVAHPDLQAAVMLTEAQKEGLGEAWSTFIHVYNSRIRGRVGSAVKDLETAAGPGTTSLTSIGAQQVAGRRAVDELELFGREEVYARVALAQRAFKVLTPLQAAYIFLMQLPNSADIVSMYRKMLDVKLEDLPEAVRPQLGIYFEEQLD